MYNISIGMYPEMYKCTGKEILKHDLACLGQHIVDEWIIG
jgi:hypothetical protein